MKRLALRVGPILAGCVVIAAGLGVSAREAFAHGGTFRGPGGAAPPGLGLPGDPTPRNPPPGARPTTPGAGPLYHPRTTTSPDLWTIWWNNNNDDILHLRQSLYTVRGSGGSVLGALGGDEAGNRTDATRATARLVKESVIPVLLWAMDHANRLYFDTESAAYIALAKVTDRPEHIALLEAGVYGPDGKPNKFVDQVVNESAALALGLLRRGDAKNQFDVKELDQVRDFLFSAFDDDALATRTRSFAMLSIGLLGDQPTGRGPAAAGGDAAPATARGAADRIVELLHHRYSNEDLPASLLLALSIQDPRAVKEETLDTLSDAAIRGRLFREPVSDLVASYAALAVGRLGDSSYSRRMLMAMTAHQTGLNVKRSAAIALGALGRRADGPERVDLAAGLTKAIEDASDSAVKNFGLISLAYVLMADIAAKRTDVIDSKGARVADTLLNVARDGKFAQRPFGALALGLVGRSIGDAPDILEYGSFRVRALDVLRAGLDDPKLDKRGRAAFAVALGVLRDDVGGTKKKLVELVSDAHEDVELRGYAAEALGMIGQPSTEIERAITEAMHERRSEQLRAHTAIALGLLGSKNAVAALLEELKGAETQNVQGQIVLALSRIGDAKAIPPLVEMLKDPLRPDLTRALCCAGLGLIGDLESSPSLVRISKDVNYTATTGDVQEVLSIL